MKVAYFSSVLNHHQIEFCDTMYEIYGDGFCFVSTNDIEEQRVKLGYKLYDRPYNLLMHKSEENREKGRSLFQDADVVILGVFLEDWLQQRLRQNKITFLHKERLFKEKPSPYWWTRSLLFVMREYWPHRNKRFYMLSASAYSYKDYRSLGFFKNKAFAWGYFPPIVRYNEEQLIHRKEHDGVRIFWAGRLIDFKKPLYVIEVADHLKSHGINFHIDMAGNGLREEKVRSEISRRNLSEHISMLGVMPPNEVRSHMEAANIYLFTSNREEGFGAVLTEAMNSGCAVVASETAGATNLLVQDGVNGVVYHKDSVGELCEKVLDLAEDTEKTKNLGIAAYHSIRDEQNAIVAARRFSQIIEEIADGKPLTHYSSGPMKLMG